MKLKYELEAVDMGEETVAVPLGQDAAKMKGVLKLNSEGSEILSMLRENTDAQAITEALAAKYDNDRAQLRTLVEGFLAQLREMGMLDEA